MPDWEIRAWLALLGHTRARQIAVVRDLLSHRLGDRMTRRDHAVCVRALRLLGCEYKPEYRGRKAKPEPAVA